MKDNIPNMNVLVARGLPKAENPGFPGTRVTGSSELRYNMSGLGTESGSLLQDW